MSSTSSRTIALRDLPGRLDGNTLGQRVAAHRQVRALDGVVHGRIELGLHADQADVRFHRLGGNGHAGDEAPAADGHDQRVDLGRRAQHLQGQRPLAGDHQRVVIGVNENETFRPAVLMGKAAASSTVSPVRITSAPCRRVLTTFTVGVFTGMTMVVGIDNRWA